MRCPHCGAATEVTDKRGTFRSRRCTNPACRDEFTTSENLVTHAEHRRVSLRTLASGRQKQAARASGEESRSTNSVVPPAAQPSPLAPNSQAA